MAFMSTLIQHRRGATDRALVLLGAIAVCRIGNNVVAPLWRQWIDPWRMTLRKGPFVLTGHVLTWSLPMAVCAGLALAYLIRTKRFRPLSITRGGWRAALDGLWGALFAIALGSIAIPTLMKVPFGFELRGWSIAGNVVSNAYEELAGRALVFTAAWYAFDNRYLAALLSGVLFGLDHDQYPPAVRVLVGVTGAVWSLVYARTGNFAAPWVAHQLADMVLDAVFPT